MKKMLLLAMLCCCVAMLWAISPVRTTCQFEVRNDLGELVTSGNVNVKLSVLKGSQAGETVYVETHSCAANTTGLVAVTLGEGGGTPSWNSLSWTNQPYYLKAEIQQGLAAYKDAGVLTLTLSNEDDANAPINRFGSRVFLSNVALSGSYTDLTNKPNIPTSLSEFSDVGDYVTVETNQNISGNKYYLGNNDFTAGTVSVANGYTLGETTSSNCEELAVNACALAQVFDSLQRRFSEVESEVDRLRDTLHNLRSAIGPMIEIASADVSDETISVVVDIVENGGSDIESASICAYLDSTYSGTPIYATNLEMEGTSFSGDLTGLEPHTTYYIKAIADNGNKNCVANTTQITDYGIPKLNEAVVLEETKSSIKIDGVLEAIGDGEARVKVCAYTDADYSGIPICSADTLMSEVGAYSLLVAGLAQNTTYYLQITSDNEHKQDTVSVSTSTLEVTLAINADPSDASITMCGISPFSVTYTAVLTGDETDSYDWSVSGGTGVASGNVYTVEYSEAGTYTVTCTAAGLTQTKQLEVVSATAAMIAICEDCGANEIKILTGSNCTSYTWYNANREIVSTSATGIVSSASIPVGVYEVVGVAASGCSTTRTVSLGRNTMHPCTISNTLRSGTLLSNGLYANKEYGTGNQLDSVSDHEGNVYRVTEISGQCWLAENMRATTSPSTGSAILLTTKYSSYTSKVACWYNYSQASYGKYGVLYNWCATVDTFNVAIGSPEVATANNNVMWHPTFSGHRRGICPEGWHIPTNAEFADLKSIVIENSKNSGRLAGGCDWQEGTSTDTKPNNYAYEERNITGMSMLPAGCFFDSGFGNIGKTVVFWSSTSVTTMHARYYGVSIGSENFDSNYTNKTMGYSVRCLRD